MLTIDSSWVSVVISPLPNIIKIQLMAAACNSAGGIIKLFLPLFFYEVYGFGFEVIALLMGVYGVGCILGAYLSGVLSERGEAQWVAAGSLLFSGMFTAGLSLIPPVALLFVIVPWQGYLMERFAPLTCGWYWRQVRRA